MLDPNGPDPYILDDDLDQLTHWLDAARKWSPEAEPTWIEHLRTDGLDLPPAHAISPADALRMVTRLILALAERGLYLTHTDHLDDLALYTYLVETALVVPAPPPRPGAVELIDLCPPYGHGIDLMLACYVSDEVRARLAGMGMSLPPRQALVADRDRTLPHPWPPEDGPPASEKGPVEGTDGGP